MPQLITINGALVDSRYLIVSVFWQVCTVALWVPLTIGLRRAYKSYKRSAGKLVDPLVYWIHLALITVCFTVIAFDPAAVFFDISGAVTLCAIDEVVIINFSHAIYAFVTAIQHYAVQEKLSAPAWMRLFKWYFVAFNFVAGNIALITLVTVDRIWSSGLVPIVCGLEGFIFNPIFIVVVLQLTNRLQNQFEASKSSTQTANHKKIIKGIRRFRKHMFGTAFMVFLFVAIVFANYIPRLMVDPSLVHSDDADFPDFARHRRFKSTFTLNWINWVGFFISAYFFYRHWIKRSSFAGKLIKDNTASVESNPTSSTNSNTTGWSTPKRSYNELLPVRTNTLTAQIDGGFPQRVPTYTEEQSAAAVSPSQGNSPRGSSVSHPRSFRHGFTPASLGGGFSHSFTPASFGALSSTAGSFPHRPSILGSLGKSAPMSHSQSHLLTSSPLAVALNMPPTPSGKHKRNSVSLDHKRWELLQMWKSGPYGRTRPALPPRNPSPLDDDCVGPEDV